MPPVQPAEHILNEFNNRDCAAFGEVYSMLYDELIYFASKLYHRTAVAAPDAVQDAFVYLWQHRDKRFQNISQVRTYLYLIVKNRFWNYIMRCRNADKYLSLIRATEDWAVARMVESEVYSVATQSLRLLPEDCAEIFRYHIEGWNAKEIATKLNISERTVYNKRLKSINILKEKLPGKKFLLLTILFGS